MAKNLDNRTFGENTWESTKGLTKSAVVVGIAIGVGVAVFGTAFPGEEAAISRVDI